jgi:hypothetical protein
LKSSWFESEKLVKGKGEVKMSVSIKPSAAEKGGFELQDGDYRVTASKYVVYQFPPNKTTGEQTPPFVALMQEFTPLGGGDEQEVYYKVQGPKTERDSFLFAPSRDDKKPVNNPPEVGDEGHYLVRLKPDAKLYDTSKVVRYMSELVNCKFPEERMEDNVSFLVGLEGHVYQRTEKGSGDVKDWKIAVFDKITKFPWEKKVGGGAASTGKGKKEEVKGKEEEEGGDDSDAAVALVQAAVEKLGEGAERKKVKMNCLTGLLKMPKEKHAGIKALLNDDDWLEGVIEAAS